MQTIIIGVQLCDLDDNKKKLTNCSQGVLRNNVCGAEQKCLWYMYQYHWYISDIVLRAEQFSDFSFQGSKYYSFMTSIASLSFVTYHLQNSVIQ